jgi:poly(3-hydroxybutyrate) depolymerase
VARIEREGAGHNFPTAAADASPCAVGEPPYVASCGYDAARALLEHLYGPLGAEPATANLAALQSFDQRGYAAAADSVSFADQGWLYVPATCRQGGTPPCRLHVVFHGCKQGATEVGDAFVRRSGYLDAAEAGHIVLLFPQLKPTVRPLNPLGCWDWWGYEGADYATKNGPQIEAVRAMVDDLVGQRRKEATNADKP